MRRRWYSRGSTAFAFSTAVWVVAAAVDYVAINPWLAAIPLAVAGVMGWTSVKVRQVEREIEALDDELRRLEAGEDL